MISFPANPQIGDLYSYSTRTWIWNGVAWQSAIYRPDGAIVSDVAPSGAKAGWSWWDRINSVLYVYDGAAWVESSQSFRTGDLDAWDYIYRVQAADGQDLEDSVISAMLKFVIGCKTDGIWDAIKASCVMAGARTLNGALVPLKGTAPTNFNFESTDYNRKTGLKGDGATKYLDTNRNNNADPQNSRHLYARVTEPEASTLVFKYLIGMSNNYIRIGAGNTPNTHAYRCASTTEFYSNSDPSTGGLGVSRNNSTQFSRMFYNSVITENSASVALSDGDHFVFSTNGTTTGGSTVYTRSQARLNFYSIGEYLDLQILHSRVSILMTDLNIAIP